jgi:hypothetical protein
MHETNMFAVLSEILVDRFALLPEEVTPDANFDDLHLDSLDVAEILLIAQDRCGGLSLEDLVGATCLREVAEVMAAKAQSLASAAS